MIKIGSMWAVKDPKENSPKLTGSMGDARLVLFKNKFKEEGKNQPDYILYVDEKKKKQEGSDSQSKHELGQQDLSY